MKKLLLALVLALGSTPALAQNILCPDRPAGDSSNACANTRFVKGTFSGVSRERLTAARDYYARATGGSDTNCSGLANVVDPGTGTIPRACAFLTLQKAANVVIQNIDTAGFNVTIGITGTFNAGMIFSGPTVGAGLITVYTPTTAAIATAGADAFVAINGAYVSLIGANIQISTATSGIGVYAYNYGAISLISCSFGAAASGHIAAGAAGGNYGPGNIYILGACSVSGSSSSFIHIVTVGSSVIMSPSAQVTFNGTPSFSSFTIGITKGLFYAQQAAPFVGATAGVKFYIHNGGTFTSWLTPAAVPGSLPGVVASGGVFNNSGVINDDSFSGLATLTITNTLNVTGIGTGAGDALNLTPATGNAYINANAPGIATNESGINLNDNGGTTKKWQINKNASGSLLFFDIVSGGGAVGLAFTPNASLPSAVASFGYTKAATSATSASVILAGGLGVSGAIWTNSSTMIASSTSYTNGAGASAGTLTNAPVAGNPTKWIPVNDNGTTRFIPAW